MLFNNMTAPQSVRTTAASCFDLSAIWGRVAAGSSALGEHAARWSSLWPRSSCGATFVPSVVDVTLDRGSDVDVFGLVRVQRSKPPT